MDKLSFEVIDGVAVLKLDNPPVNSLGLELRQALTAAIERANADAGIEAIVLIGSGDGLFRRRRYPRIRHPQGGRPPESAHRDQRGRRQRQAGHRRHRRSVHGRRSRIGDGMPLPGRHPGSAHRAAGSQAGAVARRRRHSAAAAFARRRGRAQSHRVGRDRRIGEAARHAAVRCLRRRRPAGERRELSRAG